MGKMRPEIWGKQKAYTAQNMPSCFLELVNKTSLPFISTIRDCASPRASFFEGKLLFVGEALTLLRPHTGMSFNHSAVNCLELQKVFQGNSTIKQWEKEVLQYGEKTRLLATAVGSYYQCGVSSSTFMLSVVRFILALLRQRLVGLWQSSRARL